MQKVQSAELSEQLNYKKIAFRYDVICSISDNWAEEGRRRRSKAASQRQPATASKSRLLARSLLNLLVFSHQTSTSKWRT
jgi:hypothetical protein